MHGIGKYALAAAALVAIVPAAASAQTEEGAARQDVFSSLGAYVLAGGGVTDFTKSEVKDRFGVGGGWDVRLGVGSRHYVGGEVAYVGSMRNGTGANPDLRMNGAEGVIRLQYPYGAGQWLVEPFAFGGIGWSRASLRNAPPGLKTSDDVGIVPFGAGITAGYGRVLLDARFTYRAAFSEDLALAANETPAKLQQWAVGASVGYEF